MKDHDNDPREAKSAYNVLFSKLTNGKAGRPRLKTASNIWRRTHKDAIEVETRKRAAVANTPRNKVAPLRESVSSELFAKLSEEEKNRYKVLAKQEHDLQVAEWQTQLDGKFSTKPEARQRCIDGLTSFLRPILEGVCEATGWVGTCTLGGPEPAQGGRLKVVSLHIGHVPGDSKMTYGRSERPVVKNHTLPSFGRFLRTAYSLEECRARALSVDEEGEPLTLGEDDPNVNVYRVEYPPSAQSSAELPDVGEDSLSTQSLQTNPVTQDEVAAVEQSSPSNIDASKSSSNSFLEPKAATTSVLTSTDSAAQSISSYTLQSPSTPSVPHILTLSANVTTNPVADSLPTDDSTHAEQSNDHNNSVGNDSKGRQKPSMEGNAAPLQVPSPPLRGAGPQMPTPGAATVTPNPSPPTFLDHSAMDIDPQLSAFNNLDAHVSRSPPPTHAQACSPVSDSTASTAPAPPNGTSILPNDPTTNAPLPPHAQASTPVLRSAMPVASSSRVGTRAVLAKAHVQQPLPGSSLNMSATSLTQDDIQPSSTCESLSSDAQPRTPVRRSKRTLAASTGPTAGSTQHNDLGSPASKRLRNRHVNTPSKPSSTSSTPNTPSASIRTAPRRNIIEVPDGAPEYIQKGIKLMDDDSLGQEWLQVVKSWLRFEEAEEYKQRKLLANVGRPTAIQEWISRGRSATWRPKIADPPQYAKQFEEWWTKLQPDWRRSEEGGLLVNVVEGDWSSLRLPGQNGLMSIMAGLYYYGLLTLKHPDMRGKWDRITRDCNIMFGKLAP